MTYNLEDCAALKKVTEFVYAVCARPARRPGHGRRVENGPPVAWVRGDRPAGQRPRSGARSTSSIADFEYINDCALLRLPAGAGLRPHQQDAEEGPAGSRGGSRNRKLRVSQRVADHQSRSARPAGGTEITRGRREAGRRGSPGSRGRSIWCSRRGGIKRKVIECTTVGASVPGRAARRSSPSDYQRLDKHFHGLKSWAMYQHVAHRTQPARRSRRCSRSSSACASCRRRSTCSSR